MELNEAKEEIKIILEGIDTDECANPIGWWETSYGAEFGKAKQAELLDLIDRIYMKDSMRIKSRHISGKRYEVEGVIVNAGSMSEAVRKWSRQPKKNISTNAIN